MIHFRIGTHARQLIAPLLVHMGKNLWTKIAFFFNALQLLFEYFFRILHIENVISGKLKNGAFLTPKRGQRPHRLSELFDML